MDYQSIQSSFKGSSALGEEIRSCRHSHGLFTIAEYLLAIAVVLCTILAILLSLYHKKLLNEKEHYRLSLLFLPKTSELKQEM